jgi:hypothetical protein
MNAMDQGEEKDFLEKLQSLDEPTKLKVLVVATGITMAVVLYFWLAYFNGLVASVSRPTIADNNVPVPTEPVPTQNNAGPSGLAFVYGQFMSMLHGLGNILQAPRQYIIHPPQ